MNGRVDSVLAEPGTPAELRRYQRGEPSLGASSTSTGKKSSPAVPAMAASVGGSSGDAILFLKQTERRFPAQSWAGYLKNCQAA